ncbi:MAG: pilus assembly protein [Pseudomonadota bacterium]
MTHSPSTARQRGQGMTEYIIIVALIAVAAIGVYSFFGQTVKSQVSGMSQELAGKSAASEQSKANTAAAGAANASSKTSTLGNYGNQQK